MALGATAVGGILSFTAILVAASASCNSGQQNVGRLPALRRPVMACRTGKKAMGVVVELRV